MFSRLEELLLSSAEALPLPAFAALSSFLEEVIAPIPSGPVMLVTGSLAQMQDYTLLLLFMLAGVAAVGKLAGALVVYTIADKAEDVFSGRFGKFFGVSSADLERLGARLGNGPRDYLIFTVLRALPIIPSVVLSLGGGALKIPLPLFITATLIGSIIRDAFFLYIGYVGYQEAQVFLDYLDHIESAVLYGTAGAVAAIAILLFFWHRRRSRRR